MVDMRDNKNLTYIPPLPPTSQLKRLDAENCSIKTVHKSFFRAEVMINLKNNNILEIPQKASIEYLNKGGKFGLIDVSDELSAIDLSLNPLFYPPKHVYEEGNSAVKSYLEKYPNSMVDANDVSITLIGNQEAGKTSMVHKLSGKISSAAEIMLEDRTQAFDVQKTWVEDVKVFFLDSGGHEEYLCCVPFLGRDEGLHVSVLNPADFKDEASLERAFWSWTEKLLEVSIAPHILVVISKLDTVDETEQQKEKERMKQKLVTFLETKLKELKHLRECKKERIEADLEETKAELEEALREQKLLESDPTTSSEQKQDCVAKESKLEAQRQLLQTKLSKQIYSINHLPNINPDLITFISSLTGAGFDQLEKNLLKAIKELPKIKLQKPWMKTVETLLTSYQDKTFVSFEDLLKNSDLSKEDLVEMLKALRAMGRVIWSPDSDKCQVIFHRFDQLSIMMKSFLYHDMGSILKKLAKEKKLMEHPLLIKYAEGQLPRLLIASMIEYISLQIDKPDRTITINYDQLLFHDTSTQTNDVLEAFLSTLIKRKVIMRMDSACEGMDMVFIPNLLLKRAGPQDQSTFVLQNIGPNPVFELQVFSEFDFTIGKTTFSTSCVATLHFMEKLADLAQTNLQQFATDQTLVAKTDDFEVVLHHNATYHEGRALGLRIRALNSNLLTDTVWILLQDLLIRLELDELDCSLECLQDPSECDHGKVDFNKSLENSRSPPKKGKKYKCEPKDKLPTQLAVDVIKALFPSKDKDISPFSPTPPPSEDLFETANLMSVLLTEPISDKTLVKRHPVFKESSFDKMFHFVKPLRQHFDNLSSNCSHGKKGKPLPGCQCFRSSDEYLRDFSLVERNAVMVTDGDWHLLLKSLFDESEFQGLPCSVTAAVRVVRNKVAHADYKDQSNNLWEQIRANMAFLIMHCFACLIRIESTPNPVLLAFADAFMKYEGKAYEAALKAKKVSKPTSILFRLKLFRADEYQSQTVFYLDAQDDEAKTFKNEATQIFRLDKSTPLRISYMGKFDDSVIVGPPAKGIVLSTPKCISDLNLDSGEVHLVHAEVCWKVKLEIDLPGKVLELDSVSDEPLQQIQQLVLDDSKLDKVLLFSGKNTVRSNGKVGDVSVEAVLKLFATHPTDTDRREKYLAKI